MYHTLCAMDISRNWSGLPLSQETSVTPPCNFQGIMQSALPATQAETSAREAQKEHGAVSCMSVHPLASDKPEWPPLWRRRFQDWGTQISDSEQLNIGTIYMNKQDKTACLIHSTGEFGREWILVYAWLSPLAIRLNYHNIVNQLHPQNKIKSF